MKRIISFIDGYNLYHAVKRMKKNHLKWVDLWKLSECFIAKKTDRLEDVYYFSAYAHWLGGPMTRHRAYVAALRAQGVTAILGKFKDKDRKCPKCSHE